MAHQIVFHIAQLLCARLAPFANAAQKIASISVLVDVDPTSEVVVVLNLAEPLALGTAAPRFSVDLFSDPVGRSYLRNLFEMWDEEDDSADVVRALGDSAASVFHSLQEDGTITRLCGRSVAVNFEYDNPQQAAKWTAMANPVLSCPVPKAPDTQRLIEAAVAPFRASSARA